MDDLNVLIGNNLMKLRKERGCSLDQVAQLSNVSKSMLSQIEKGKKTPTVTTLWKIASGLNVSTSLLMDNPKPEVNYVSCKDLIPLVENNGNFKAFPLLPFNTETYFEVYQMHIAPNSEHKSNPHTSKVKEYVFISEGKLTIDVNNTKYSVANNEALVFPGDIKHTYINDTAKSAKAFVLIAYPNQ